MNIASICGHQEEGLVPATSALALSNFPNELVEEIIGYLGGQDLGRLCLVSKEYRRKIKAIEGSRIQRDVLKIYTIISPWLVYPNRLLEIESEIGVLQDQWNIQDWLKYRRIIQFTIAPISSHGLDTLCSQARLKSQCLQHQPLIALSRIDYLSDNNTLNIIQRLISVEQFKPALLASIRILDEEKRQCACRSIVHAALNMLIGVEGVLKLIHSTLHAQHQISALYRLIVRVLLEQKLYKEIGQSLLEQEAIQEALIMDRPNDVLESLVDGWLHLKWEDRAVRAAIKITAEAQQDLAVDRCFQSLLDRRDLPYIIKLLRFHLAHTHKPMACYMRRMQILVEKREFDYAVSIVKSQSLASWKRYPILYHGIYEYVMEQLVLAKAFSLGVELVADYAGKYQDHYFIHELTEKLSYALAKERQYEQAIFLLNQHIVARDGMLNSMIYRLIKKLIDNKEYEQASVLAANPLFSTEKPGSLAISNLREK